MLELIHGNRLDILAARMLAAWPDSDVEDLRPQTIVVPSAGIARWLKYTIADRREICCNVEFPYPAQFIWRTFADVLPGIPRTSPFDAGSMAWRLFGLFRSLTDNFPADPSLAPLFAYLTRVDQRGRMDFARRVAGLFDQYLVLRTDWLQTWSQGRLLGLMPAESERWQARLWRELLKDMAGIEQHPKDAVFAELARLRARGVDLALRLPARVHVFAVPLLPPLYCEVFLRLAQFTDVVFFMLNPCREYWADIVSERELARMALEDRGQVEFRDVGHPLLASLGRQRRDNLALFAALSGEENVVDEDAFVVPAANTLLHRLQRSILDLEDLALSAVDLAAGDPSIRIHACHSLMRQLQALHDQLLAQFEAHGDLRPADVVVMLPDLDGAAPLIDAVFGTAPAQRHIPYSITGRKRADATPLLRAFNTLLNLASCRFDAITIIELLQTPAVARRFNLTAPDLEQIRLWMRDSGIRWGIDASHRSALGLPAEVRHTWAEGLSRLLLGYALPGGGGRAFGELLPCDDIEGGVALVLGNFVRALSELCQLAEALAAPRSAADWSPMLNRLMRTFFAPDEAEYGEVARLQRAIAGIAEDAARAGNVDAVGSGVVGDAIAAHLAAAGPGAVPSGAVTFCGIEALRGIPHRIVCLIGLEDGAFPRHAAALEFDLMTAQPRLGDRVRRDDDRGCFLDAMMAAGDLFYLSYNGRDLRDNAVLPPSIVVGEFLDYLGRSLAGGRDAVTRALVVEHPLQPFSARYFAGQQLFSYAGEYLATARATVAPLAHKSNSRELFEGALPLPDDAWRQIELGRLIRFFGHPVKFLLRERLRIDLAAADEELASTEPFVLEKRASWKLRDRLLEMTRNGLADSAIAQAAAAGAELPHAFVGSVALKQQREHVAQFAALLERLQPVAALPAVAFAFESAGISVSGVLEGLSDKGLLGYRFARRSVFDLLNAWLRHLVLNHLKPAGAALVTRWLTEDMLLTFRPVDDAKAQLDALLALYWIGLQQPLLFPPRSALVLLEKGESKARAKWASEWGTAENNDPWYRLLFGGARADVPVGFGELAKRILGPLLAHLEQTEVAGLALAAGRDLASTPENRA